MSEISYGDKIFKLLHKCNKRHNTPDLHSFRADIKNGTVFVDCRGFEVYMESSTYDSNGKEHVKRWTGTLIAASSRLEILQIDLLSIEI